MKKKRCIIIFSSLIFASFLVLFFSINLSAATYTCSSCGSCSAYLTNSTTVAGDTVQLDTPLSGIATSCIDFGGKDNVIFDCQGNLINGTRVSNTIGIYINNTGGGSNNNTIENCNINNFYSGIDAPLSWNNVFTNITSSFNTNYGIYFHSSENNTMTNLIVSNNQNGIFLEGSDNIMTNLTVNNNSYGFYFYAAHYNLLKDSIIKENRYYETIFTYAGDCKNNLTNVTSSGGRLIALYNSTVNLQNQTFAQLTLCNANNSIINNVTIQDSDTLNNSLLQLMWVYNTTFSNIDSSNNYYGIDIFSSSNNIFTNFTANYNNQYGFFIRSPNNTFINLTANYNNLYGVYMYTSNNSITNSTFQENRAYDIDIDNSAASYCSDTLTNINGSGNRPIGFYNSTAVIQNQTFSQLILCNANDSIIDNVTIAGSDTLQNNGLFAQFSSNLRISNVNSSGNQFGIFLIRLSNATLMNITTNLGNVGIYQISIDGNNLTNIIANNNSYGLLGSGTYFNNILFNITANNNSNTGFNIAGINNSLTNITANYNGNYGLVLGSSGLSNSTLTNSIIQNNKVSGIYLAGSNNSIYNNYFNNTVDYQNSAGVNNSFNTSLSAGTNILGGPSIGGNLWATPNGTGFSETCTDANSDGICDSSYNLNGTNYDYLPLSLTIGQIGSSSGNEGSSGTSPPSNGGGGGSTTIQTQAFTTIMAQPFTLNISVADLDAIKITIMTTTDIADVLLTIFKTTTPADSETGLPPGVSYQAFKVHSDKLNSTNTANVTFEFKVDKNWLRQHGSFANNIKLFRKADNSNLWVPLVTVLTDADNNYYYYSAFSPGFSTFLIFSDQSECMPGKKRCSMNDIQLCLENFTWSSQSKCDYLCVNAECVNQLAGINLSTIFYGVMAGIVISILIIIFFILRNLKIIMDKNRSPKFIQQIFSLI